MSTKPKLRHRKDWEKISASLFGYLLKSHTPLKIFDCVEGVANKIFLIIDSLLRPKALDLTHT